MRHTSNPPPPSHLGMEEASLRVRADLDLEAVELTIPGELEIMLSPTATIDLIYKLAGALRRLDKKGGE